MKLVFATNNPHKLEEIREILGKERQVLSLKAIGCHDEIPEEQDTLEGNALQKAHYIKDKYGFDCFADDTGLEIAALNGRPGVYSARYAGEGKSPEDNMVKVLKEMQGVADRSARFRTVIALLLGDEEFIFEGEVEGEMLTEKHGDEGFGYDPIFRPVGYEKSFAEMSMDEKNHISHRGKAVQKLVEFLNNKNI
ncbi:MAG: non-canonical purine NTP diphosphatase [Culturomica sp.]|jgi:XTP/dITP diphosphohydrolase|nr:non-canonical purine NTP diphosphatase [Culturomica sp.]